jgi:hypothetical protein
VSKIRDFRFSALASLAPWRPFSRFQIGASSFATLNSFAEVGYTALTKPSGIASFIGFASLVNRRRRAEMKARRLTQPAAGRLASAHGLAVPRASARVNANGHL